MIESDSQGYFRLDFEERPPWLDDIGIETEWH